MSPDTAIETENSRLRARVAELESALSCVEEGAEQHRQAWLSSETRVAELESKQMSPAALAEFEIGKEQRDALRARVAELEADNRKWESAARPVGVSCPGAMQQAKRLADAAVKALRLMYDDTAPVDITNSVKRLKRYVRAAAELTDQVMAQEARMAQALAELERHTKEGEDPSACVDRALAILKEETP